MPVHRPVSRSIFVLLFLCSAWPSLCKSTDGETSPSIELLRDPWGTPHIFSNTDEGALYGLGYASAEDRLFQMCFNRLIMQGRVAEIFGDLGGGGNALKSDRSLRSLGAYATAQTIVKNLDPETRRLLQAYSDGVNGWVAKNKDGLHYLFKKYGFEPDPWTPADCVVSWWHLVGGYWGLGGEIQREYKPRMAKGRELVIHLDEDAAVVHREDVSDAWVASVEKFIKDKGLKPFVMEGSDVWEGPKFSHGWVLGKKVTTTGAALLVGDPQVPIGNPALWYEFHISGKTLHARGVGMPGSPGLLVGFTPGVAWTVTALAGDQADFFLLKANPDKPNQYKLDGKWEDMKTRTEVIKVKGGEPVTETYRESVFGPVVSQYLTGLKPGEEAAIRQIPLAEPDRDTAQGHFAMMRSRNVAEFLKAVQGWRYPGLNCVFGDSKGDIGFSILGAFPLESANAGQDGSLARPGESKSDNWRGAIPYDVMPQVVNPRAGWLVTANHRAIQSFYRLRLGLGGGGETLRGLRIKQRVQERLDAGKKFGFEDALNMEYDSVQPMSWLIVQMGYRMRDNLKEELPADALKALKYLEPWRDAGGHMNWDEPGVELVTLFPAEFREGMYDAAWIYGGGTPGTGLFTKVLSERLKKDPDAAFHPDEKKYVAEILAKAWQGALAKYGDNPTTWHETAARTRERKVMGYCVSLDGFPSLDPALDVKEPDLPVSNSTTILSQRGQSYTQVVNLADPDSSLCIMPFGNSERPDSPFRFSVWGDWAIGRLHPAPVTHEAVRKISVSRLTLYREIQNGGGRAQ